jgi:type II secretory pathway pseudopilin PulG
MRLAHAHKGAGIGNTRPGFTIIELLVVIVIIILLMGLLMAAVQKVMITLDETKVITELWQMDQGAEQFRSKHGDYPPSRIYLSETGSYPNYGLTTPQGQLETYSVDTLRRLFTGIDLALANPAVGGVTTAFDLPGVEWHDWNGNGVRDANPIVLEGEECLVYFLGGIPQIDATTGLIGGLGFCTDMVLPTRPTAANVVRNGPYFVFKSERLRLSGIQSPNLFAVYRDHFGTPYAYFRARYGTENTYPCNTLTTPPPPPGTNVTDCSTLLVTNGSPNFMPYCESSRGPGPFPNLFIKFHRPDKYQIISAGRDQLFGNGGSYNPADPDTLTRVDKDNMTNFAGGKLGG